MAAKQLILCDSNIIINLFKGHEKVKVAMQKIGTENIAISIITYAEIIYGTKKADLKKIKLFLSSIPLLILMQALQMFLRVLF